MKKLFILSLVLFMSGCGTKVLNKGKIFTDDEKVAFEKVNSKTDVLKELGTPSATTMFGKDETWIYFGSVMRQTAFLNPYYEKYELNLLTFKDGKIQNRQTLTLKDKRNIHFDKSSTPIENAVELNPVEELFNNIGRFSTMPSGGPM